MRRGGGGGITPIPFTVLVLKKSKKWKELHFKGGPYRFSGYQDPSLQTYRQTDIMLHLYKVLYLLKSQKQLDLKPWLNIY